MSDRYVIFSYSTYYPCGGVHDVLTDNDNDVIFFNTEADAIDYINKNNINNDYNDVFRLSDFKVVWSKECW